MSANDFIISINIDTNEGSFTFPGIGQYDINWGDGTSESLDIEPGSYASHTYDLAGNYDITVSNWVSSTGNAGPQLSHSPYVENVPYTSEKITEIKQWGTVQWSSQEFAFYNSYNMIGTFTDAPDLSACTDLSYMFSGCALFNSNIGNWNVSNVTNMSSMLSNASVFNQNIGGWNVSNVTNMSSMFSNMLAFNQDIGDWDVSSVTNMSNMFNGASAFNQDIGGWDVSNVTDMSYMFSACIAFNSNISNWNVSSVTNMAGMFTSAETFNQDIGGWNVSNVTEMYDMFNYAIAFNQDIGDWDVSSVINMSGMFSYASVFNQNIGGWDVSNVVFMTNMFNHATAFNQDIGGWDISNVGVLTNMLDYSALSTENFSRTLIGWANLLSVLGGPYDDYKIVLGAAGLSYDATQYVNPGLYDNGVDAANFLKTPIAAGPGWKIARIYPGGTNISGTYYVYDYSVQLGKPGDPSTSSIAIYGASLAVGDKVTYNGVTFTIEGTYIGSDSGGLGYEERAYFTGAWDPAPTYGNEFNSDQVILLVVADQGGANTGIKDGLIPQVRVAKGQLLAAVREVTKAELLPIVHVVPMLQDNIRVTKNKLIRN